MRARERGSRRSRHLPISRLSWNEISLATSHSMTFPLQGVISALQQPGIAPVRSKIWHMAAFDGTASANDLGSTLVLNGAGDVIANSTSVISHALNLADRDYFRIHQNKPDVGLFFSRPFRSRLRGGDASIAISRRISAPDGHFNGVVVAAVRLAYFQKLFKKLNLGYEGSVAHPSPHFVPDIDPPNSPLPTSISANRCISGNSLCSGMFGISS
jgi:hypothetical protein